MGPPRQQSVSDLSDFYTRRMPQRSRSSRAQRNPLDWKFQRRLAPKQFRRLRLGRVPCFLAARVEIHRQLSVISVLTGITNQSARTGTAIDGIINATPVIRWAEVYGPLIDRVSKHVAMAVMQFSTCIRTKSMNERLDDHIALAEDELTTRRLLWLKTVEVLFNAQLLNLMEGETPEVVRHHIDEFLFKRWIGLTPDAYCQL